MQMLKGGDGVWSGMELRYAYGPNLGADLYYAVRYIHVYPWSIGFYNSSTCRLVSFPEVLVFIWCILKNLNISYLIQ